MGPEKRLNAYLRQVRSKPFRWGEHDCLIFSNAAFTAYHGAGYADDLVGGYMADGEPALPSRLRDRFNAESFDEVVERKLRRVDYVPPRGALVATKRAERWLIGYALGICVGTKAAFLSRGGVIYVSLDDIDKSWVPKCKQR
jgi:hypothetical protein